MENDECLPPQYFYEFRAKEQEKISCNCYYLQNQHLQLKLMLSKATELRNICRNNLRQVQRCVAPKLFVSHRFGTLYLFIIFYWLGYKYFAAMLLFVTTVAVLF